MPRVAMFEDRGDKDRTNRIQAVLTQVGRVAFEETRQQLRILWVKIMQREPAIVSDADTVEYLVRGPEQSARYFARRRDRELADGK